MAEAYAQLKEAKRLIGEVYAHTHDEKLEAVLFNTVKPALDWAVLYLDPDARSVSESPNGEERP